VEGLLVKWLDSGGAGQRAGQGQQGKDKGLDEFQGVSL